MSSTNFTIGLGDSTKTSSKVLRPPGGGNSQLFGDDVPNTPRSVKNHMASNIFGSDQKASVKQNGDQKRGQKPFDSYTRLFGEPERNNAPSKNHMKSSIPIGGTGAANGSSSTASSSSSLNGGNGVETNGHKTNGHHQNGNGTSALSSASSSARNGKTENGGGSSSYASSEYQNGGASKTDGNPVTGEGYKGAEINTSIPSLNGANQVINKNRIPPGGYSSGLW